MTDLWQHQRDALTFIDGKAAALLAMGMGSGKSAVAIHALERRGIDRALIICPKSVASVWPAEFAKHAALDWRIETLADGRMADRARQVPALLNDPRLPLVVIVNYDVLPYAVGGALKQYARRFGALVLDECMRLKSPAGKQSRLASQIADRIPFRLGLTGTPMPHSPLDVYAQFRALDKSVFGTSNTVFKARYAVMGGFEGKQVIDFQNLDDLRNRMDQITYWCKTEDVLDLPPVMDVTRTCALEPKTRKVYDSMKADLIAELEAGTVTASNALVKLLRLAQLANGFATTEEGTLAEVSSEKAKLLADVLDDLHGDYDARQEPIVVFCRFKHDLATARRIAKDRGLRDGELSGSYNDLAAWHDGDIDLLAVQLQAGGVGIDLTRARYCIYFSHAFSLGDYDQSRARVHRPGQERPVTYIHLVAQATIDGQIRKALEAKREVIGAVVDAIRA